MNNSAENPSISEGSGLQTPSSPLTTDSILNRLRKRPAPSQKRPRTQEKQPKPTRPTEPPRPTKPKEVLPYEPNHRVHKKKIARVENHLVFGPEVLQVYSKLSQVKSRFNPGPGLDFLPPLDPGVCTLLQDDLSYYSSERDEVAINCLLTTLQLTSEGRVLENMLRAEPEDISLVLSYIHSRLVVCYLRINRAHNALEHAHRSIQLNPSHFQNHLRQAVVYRMLGWHWLAARSALTADWLYCALAGTEQRISSQLKLYWQAMLNEAQYLEEKVTVVYSPFSSDLSSENILQTEKTLMEQQPSVFHVYTDPRGLHVLPHTTDWLTTAPHEVQRYYITLGFMVKKDGMFFEKVCSRMWPALAEARGDRTPVKTNSRYKPKLLKTEELKKMYEKILPVLDMMQATQISSGLVPGCGLMEWLQFSSLLDRHGFHREHSGILQRFQAQINTIPYLPPPISSSSSPQRDETMLQQLQADFLDELAGSGTGSQRIWDQVLQVGWLEELINSVEKAYRPKKKIQPRNRSLEFRAKSNVCRKLFPPISP